MLRRHKGGGEKGRGKKGEKKGGRKKKRGQNKREGKEGKKKRKGKGKRKSNEVGKRRELTVLSSIRAQFELHSCWSPNGAVVKVVLKLLQDYGREFDPSPDLN